MNCFNATVRGAGDVLAVFSFLFAGFAGAALPPGPVPLPYDELPQPGLNFHSTLVEVSWDFGDVAPFDWRTELVTSDPTARFLLRWRYLGPGYTGARLVLSDQSGTYLGEYPLPPRTPDGAGFRKVEIKLGDLPAAPPVTLQLEVSDSIGTQLGALSNTVQIQPETFVPFLYAPLFVPSLIDTYALPGIAGGATCVGPFFGSDEWMFYAGDRRFDGAAGKIGPNDLWHIGSDTKAMTCTLLAILMDQGYTEPATGDPLSWNTTVAEIFPEWQLVMQSRFFVTHLAHLACHRSGMRMTPAEDAPTRQVGGLNNDPRAFRVAVTQQLISRVHRELDDDGNLTGPVTPVGGPFFYGHGNYLILGAVIERLTGKTYEQVMDEELFTPLGMTTAAFGMPYEEDRPGSYYQPHGHRRETTFPHAVYVSNTACPPIWNPAGSCYLSMADWLRFLRFHLTGSGGLLSLSMARLNELHTPFPGGDSDSYGYGWGIDPKGPVLTHGGSYGRFNALCGVDVGNGIAAAAVTNLGPSAKFDEDGNVIWEETWSGLAIGQFYNYLRAQLLAKLAAGSDFVPGSFGFGSLGGLGLASPTLATDGRRLLGFENLWDLNLAESEGVAKFLGRDLFAWDDFHLREVRRNQPPQYRGHFRGEDGVETIRFSANPGALYQIFRSPTLDFTRGARPIAEVMAEGETIEVPVSGRAPVDFYQAVEQ